MTEHATSSTSRHSAYNTYRQAFIDEFGAEVFVTADQVATLYDSDEFRQRWNADLIASLKEQVTV